MGRLNPVMQQLNKRKNTILHLYPNLLRYNLIYSFFNEVSTYKQKMEKKVILLFASIAFNIEFCKEEEEGNESVIFFGC
jgi:hypothetical protein